MPPRWLVCFVNGNVRIGVKVFHGNAAGARMIAVERLHGLGISVEGWDWSAGTAGDES